MRALLPEVAELIVKDGDIGATAFVGADVVFAPALVVEVVALVGAGDAFAGGYLAGRLSGTSVSERLRAGHERAARTLQTTTDSIDEPHAPVSIPGSPTALSVGAHHDRSGRATSAPNARGSPRTREDD